MENQILFCGAVIFALELWRRHLVRTRKIPGWVSFATYGGYAITACGVAYSYRMYQHALDAISTTESGNKATLLANGISSAMTGNAIAIAGIVVSAVLLCTFAVRAKPQ